MWVVGTLLQRVEHVGARGMFVHHRAIAIILEEVATIQDRQRDRHVEVRPRGHITEYVTVRVPLPVTVGLLEAELYQETEELTRVERAGDVRGVHVVRHPKQQAKQKRVQDARVQPFARDRHFSASDGSLP